MNKYLNLRPNIALWLIFAFLVNSLGPLPVYAQLASPAGGDFRLPAPWVRVALSPEFNPPILKGLKVHPDNPFRFDFILDKGDLSVIPAKAGIQNQEQLKTEATKLIKYFLASLTIPEKDLWVNLSPYEKDRIVPESFGQTEMGRDLLAEDYMLKQITASLIYPEDDIGKKFWKRVYEEAAKEFGTTNIPVNTFNKVWIVPEKAIVYENAKAGTAYVVESKLKVMLEQDYLALEKNPSRLPSELGLNAKAPQVNNSPTNDNVNALGSQIVREIVIPELTKEVNEGKNFTQLRQVYNSLILATWYKKKIKDSILAQVYADKNKTVGVEYTSTVIPAKAGIQNRINSDMDPRFRGDDNKKDDVELIYQRYLQAFKKGVFNYIKEDIPLGADSKKEGILPRKYFSGGFFGARIDYAMAITDHLDDSAIPGIGNDVLIQARLDNVISDKAMTADEVEASILSSLAKTMSISSEQMETRLDQPITKVNNQKIIITQYKNKPDEIVPFLRVGKFIIVDAVYFEKLEENVKKYEFLIRKSTSILNGDVWANVDMNYNKLGWSGYLIGALASMVAHEGQIKGSSFIDFGAGFTGILAVAAKKLGAAEIILFERNDLYMQQLKSNLKMNDVPEDICQFRQIDFIALRALKTKRKNIVFVLNLLGYGALSNLSELPAVLDVLKNKTIRLGLVSGGPEAYYPNAIRMLASGFNVEKAIVTKGPAYYSDHNRIFTTLIALPNADTAMRSPKQVDEDRKAILDLLLNSPQPLTRREVAVKLGKSDKQKGVDFDIAFLMTVRPEIKAKIKELIAQGKKKAPKVLTDMQRVNQSLRKAKEPLTLPELSSHTGFSIQKLKYLIYVKKRSRLRNNPKLKIDRNAKIRSKSKIKSDREELRKIVQSGQYRTIKKIADAVGRDYLEVRGDLRAIGLNKKFYLEKELNVRSKEEINASRARLKAILDKMPITPDGLAKRTGMPYDTVWSDLDKEDLLGHPNYRTASTMVLDDAVIDTIVKGELSPDEMSFLISQLRFRGNRSKRLLKTSEINYLMRSNNIANRLRFLKNLFNFIRDGNQVFSAAQAKQIMYAIKPNEAPEDIYNKIKWLLEQENIQSNPLFIGKDIVNILLSQNSLDQIVVLVTRLRGELTNKGEQLFNGKNIALIISQRLTSDDIDDLIYFAAEQNGGASKDENISRIIKLSIKKVSVRVFLSDFKKVVSASTVYQALRLFLDEIKDSKERSKLERAIGQNKIIISINGTKFTGLTGVAQYHLERGDKIEIEYMDLHMKREDVLVKIEGKDEIVRVLATDLRDALSEFLKRKGVSNEVRMKVSKASGISFNVNSRPVDEAKVGVNSGDLIEIRVPFSVWDRAQTSQIKGGIDLTPANMNLQTKMDSRLYVNGGSSFGGRGDGKQGIQFHIDSAMLEQLRNAPGFTPVIINIQPMNNLTEFLGVLTKSQQ